MKIHTLEESLPTNQQPQTGSQIKKNKQTTDFNVKIAPYMKIGVLIATFVSIYNMYQQNYLSAMLNIEFTHSVFYWAMIAILSVSHIVYFVIWHYPQAYTRMCEKLRINRHPVDLIFSFVYVGKVIQLGFALSWYFYINDFFLTEQSEYHFNILTISAGLFLIIAGQWLNMAVWNTIGVNGVCYGFKLGKPINWVTGFPFNIGVSNPQYVGSVLTNLGILTILINPTGAEKGMVFVWLFNTLFYAFSAYVETHTGSPQNKAE